MLFGYARITVETYGLHSSPPLLPHPSPLYRGLVLEQHAVEPLVDEGVLTVVDVLTVPRALARHLAYRWPVLRARPGRHLTARRRDAFRKSRGGREVDEQLTVRQQDHDHEALENALAMRKKASTSS